LLQEDLKGGSNRKITANAVKMIQALSDIFRYNLDMKSHMVTFENEIQNIRNYLILQKFRYEDKISVIYDIDESILDCYILKMTLQPLVENSIVHGLELKRGVGEIKISIVGCNSCVKITISDNGTGMEDSKINEMNELLCRNEDEQFMQAHKEVGIYNVNARIKYYFGSSYGLKYHRNESGGITAEILLPIRRAVSKEGLPG
jgi:two-component system sensor histidine kinase YesM